MNRLVLLGDSIFDNAAYVRGGPDVVTQLGGVLPPGWSASLAAVDGAVTVSVPAQLTRLPRDATHLAVSVGGNDALGHSHVLGARAGTVGEALAALCGIADEFEEKYRDMLAAVLGRGLPTALCTIYDTPPSAPEQPVIKTALAIFNDRITRAVFAHGLPLIDLRLICDEDGDYANPIEPSVQGGMKMARALAALAADWPAGPRSGVFAGQ